MKNMNVAFPCPELLTNMTVVADGYHCGTCDKTVYDVTGKSEEDVKKMTQADESLCVVYETKTKPMESQSFSIRRFGLAVLIVFGVGLFSFASAQVEKNIRKVSKEITSDIDNLKVGGFVEINIQRNFSKSMSGKVNVELPNGKEDLLYVNSDGVYHYEVPAYCAGKEITFTMHTKGRVKKETIFIPLDMENQEVNFNFLMSKKKAERPVFRTMGCPSF